MRDVHMIPVYLARAMTDSAAFKWVCASILAMAQYLFGSDVTRNAAIAAAGLMLLDTITGLVAAWVLGAAFQSGKFSRVLVKIVSYGSAIIVAAVVTQHVPGLSTLHETAVTLAVSLILCTEALSVLENLDKMGFKSFGWLRRMLSGKIEEITEGRQTNNTD